MDSWVDAGLIQELSAPNQTLILENYAAGLTRQAKVKPMTTPKSCHRELINPVTALAMAGNSAPAND